MADEKLNIEAVLADPYNMEAKKLLHKNADAKNRIEIRSGKPTLTCGGKKAEHKGGGFCRSRAGAGTDHPGSGRCKFCGGLSTGPKTPEGKAAVAKNSTKHGLYATVLNDEEVDDYQELVRQKQLGLEHEIYFWKAKIINYLRTYKNRLQRKRSVARDEGDLYASVEFYTAGSMEDRALDRALNTLGRLVEKHARLNQEAGDDMLSQINKELGAASQGQVSISWGGKPQQRVTEKPEE